MEMKKLVTIIIPCYNGQAYLERFIESLKNQTYKNLQIIFVDDGSSDNTLKILRKYTRDFKEFAQYEVLTKENGGAASAVNYALKHVKGEYLCWADCDDIIEPYAIEKKAQFLDKNEEYALVMNWAKAYDYNTNNFIRNLSIKEEDRNENIFKKLIYPGVPCYPGVFMIRTRVLFERLNNKTITYDKNVGQNWQLLLPVAYKNKCGYIDEYLYKYFVREDSHSHNTNYEKELVRIECQERILKETLYFIDKKDKNELFSFVDNVTKLKKMKQAFIAEDINTYKENLHNLKYKKNSKKYIKLYIKYFILKNKLLKRLYKRIKGEKCR